MARDEKKQKKKRKTITRSNLYIPKKFSPHTYNRFIKQFIDEYNFGYLKKDGTKSWKFSTDHINICWASHNPHSIDRIKLKLQSHIVPHLQNNATYFYSLNIHSYVAMYTIDLDANKDSTHKDLLQAAEYIVQSFHPNTYYEISTSGSGIHIYIFVDYEGYSDSSGRKLKPDNINYLMNSSQDAYSTYLSKLISSLGYNCKVDQIKGTYPIYKYDEEYNTTAP